MLAAGEVVTLTFVPAVGQGREGLGELLACSEGCLSGEKVVPVCRGWGRGRTMRGAKSPAILS